VEAAAAEGMRVFRREEDEEDEWFVNVRSEESEWVLPPDGVLLRDLEEAADLEAFLREAREQLQQHGDEEDLDPDGVHGGDSGGEEKHPEDEDKDEDGDSGGEEKHPEDKDKDEDGDSGGEEKHPEDEDKDGDEDDDDGDDEDGAKATDDHVEKLGGDEDEDGDEHGDGGGRSDEQQAVLDTVVRSAKELGVDVLQRDADHEDEWFSSLVSGETFWERPAGALAVLTTELDLDDLEAAMEAIGAAAEV